MAIGLIMGGASLISGLMGRNSARKQAKAQMELARRQANAAYNNQMRQMGADYRMGRENLIFGAQQQLLQERLNNKIAMENYEYAQHVDDLRLAETNGNIARANKKRAAMEMLKRESMINQYVGQAVNQAIDKEDAKNQIRQASSQAVAQIGARAAARGLNPGNSMNNPLMAMSTKEAATKLATMKQKDDNNRRVASKQLHLQLAMSHLAAQGDAMKQKIEGRPPTLFDSTRTVQHLLARNMGNMLTQFKYGAMNAFEAREAGLANAQTAYNNAKSAANAQFMSQAIGTVAGMAYGAGMFGGSSPSSAMPQGSMGNMHYTSNSGVPAGYETGFNLYGNQYSYQTFN